MYRDGDEHHDDDRTGLGKDEFEKNDEVSEKYSAGKMGFAVGLCSIAREIAFTN